MKLLSQDKAIVSDRTAPMASPLKVWLTSVHLIGIACLLSVLVMALSMAFIDLERSDKR